MSVMKHIFLLGDPVAHSRSPLMQNAAFAHLGLAIRYEALHTPAAELVARIAALRDEVNLGANVTLPHKAAVMPLLDELEPEAARIGAVNTIYKGSGGALVGANTDAPALIEALREDAGCDPAGRWVVLLGASGAARAALYALLGAGVAGVVVANRTLERAEALLADAFGEEEERLLRPPRLAADALPPLIALALDDPELAEYLAGCALLINATSLGWKDGETPLPAPPLSAGCTVYDMVYRPTRLLREAEARGARVCDGLGMLLRQGALALTRWTGQPAPLEVMRAALVSGMGA